MPIFFYLAIYPAILPFIVPFIVPPDKNGTINAGNGIVPEVRHGNGQRDGLSGKHAQIAPYASATLTHTRASASRRDGRRQKAARTNYFFFGLPYAYTQTDADKRACTQGYKK